MVISRNSGSAERKFDPAGWSSGSRKIDLLPPVLNSIATERPIIFVTTEQTPSVIIKLLREKGMGEPTPATLSFVDAFTEHSRADLHAALRHGMCYLC